MRGAAVSTRNCRSSLVIIDGLVAIDPCGRRFRGSRLFSDRLHCYRRRDILGVFDSFHNRCTSGDHMLCYVDLLRTEANFIKLVSYRVADDKDIPRMD